MTGDDGTSSNMDIPGRKEADINNNKKHDKCQRVPEKKRCISIENRFGAR